MKSTINFFKHTEPKPVVQTHAHPLIETCFGCLEPANPAWGQGEAIYCSECAPPQLKNPGKYIYGEGNADTESATA